MCSRHAPCQVSVDHAEVRGLAEPPGPCEKEHLGPPPGKYVVYERGLVDEIQVQVADLTEILDADGDLRMSVKRSGASKRLPMHVP